MPVYWGSSAGVITVAGSGLNTELAICKLALTWLGGDPNSLNSVTTVTTNSSKEDIYCNQVYDSARKAVLEDFNWGFAKRHLQLAPADGYAASAYNAANLGGISQADPAVVTANGHGFSDGWLVKLNNVAGMTEMNGRIVRVANSTNNTFECYGLSSTKMNAYTSGGEAIRYEAYQDYRNGYAFRVPADFLRPIHVEGRPQWEVVGSGNSRRILSTEQYPIIEYIGDVTTVSEMSEGFKRAWAARIAAEIATPLVKTDAGVKAAWGFYQQVLERESKPSDARNADPKHLINERSSVLSEGGWVR